VAAKTMEIYRRDGIFAHSAKIGAYAKAQLQERLVDSLPLVEHVSGYGMLLGLEVVRNNVTKEDYSKESRKMFRVQERALDKGLFLRVCDLTWAPGNRFMFCPPLVSTEVEIDAMIDIIIETFKEELTSEYAEGARS
jgi:adenosylmethionine-8-amino-7-oxononanoate aminotransferase